MNIKQILNKAKQKFKKEEENSFIDKLEFDKIVPESNMITLDDYIKEDITKKKEDAVQDYKNKFS